MMFNLNFIMMKKKYFLSAIALCGLMTLASCGSDDDPIPEKGGDEPEVAAGEQVIILDMQDTDVLSTKSRPLYSTTNQGSEKVTDVKLLVFQATADGNKLKKVIHVPNWNSTSSEYNYGRKRTIKLTGDDKLKASDFDGDLDVNITILAVGQDETKDLIPAPFKVNGHTIPGLALDVALTKDGIWNAGAKAGEGFLKTDAVTYPTYSELSVGNNKAASVVSEIFSGQSKPVQVNIKDGIGITVLLKRQVAGVLGYFNRIPAYVKEGTEGAYNSVGAIRLVSSVRNTQVDLTTQLDQQTDDTTNGTKLERVMNGFAASATADANFGTGEATRAKDAYTIYQIDLTKWFKKGTEATTNGFWGNSDALIKEEDGITLDVPLLGDSKGWVNGINSTNDFPTVATGSVLAGEFMIPINGIAANSTFELQLLDSIGSQVLKTWKVKLDAVSQDPDYNDGETVYNIYRNHLYQLGLRGKGDSPENPGTDPDKPQPLDKDQELIIKINDQWEFIHDMEIE